MRPRGTDGNSLTRPGPSGPGLAVLGAALAAAMTLSGSAHARPWRKSIDRVVGGRTSVSVRVGDRFLYEHRARARRVPASTQKLLLSMALLDSLGPGARIETRAAARRPRRQVVPGNLWILGRGDPTIADRGRFARSLSVPATQLWRLARRIRAAGVRRVRGRVMASTGYFRHDWYAPGWRPYFPGYYVGLPSALTYEGNVVKGRYVRHPERHVSRALTRRLERAGVAVRGRPGTGRPPRGLPEIAGVRSAPLRVLLRHMNRRSDNFFAEVLGKRLAAERYERNATIAGGARAIEAWARGRGVSVEAHDSSGLSYANRLSAHGLVRLLGAARREPWGARLRHTLARPGHGTLDHRLKGVPLRAKTGTLDGVSALAGWVWLRRAAAWAQFSILSSGLPKSAAVAMENEIARTLSRRARARRGAHIADLVQKPSVRAAGAPCRRGAPCGRPRAARLDHVVAPHDVAVPHHRPLPPEGSEAAPEQQRQQ